MQSILEDLWNGHITPYKSCGCSDPELKEICELVKKNEATLTATLTEAHRELFKNYLICSDEYQYLMTVHAFREGFSLACRLLTDVLSTR